MRAKFGELFGEARRRRGVTLRQIQQAIGYAPSFWSEIESGRRLPPSDEGVLRKISKFLDIKEAELIKAAQTDRVKKDTSVMEKLYNVDPELAWGFFRAMESSDDDKILKYEFNKLLEALSANKKG
jgi:transcriptional regulator with XRE-family HTH domain